MLLLAAAAASTWTGVSACSFLATTLPWDGENLTAVNKFMRPRGPDGTRCVRMRDVTVCHNLLHMTGEMVKQPFVDEGASIVAAYNGEIYNYEELADKLGIGPVRSDGEVVMPMYKKYREGFARHLDGEFAVVIFDFAAGQAVLAVDAFSTKPLWFSRHGGGLRVASYRSAVEGLGAPPESVKMVDPNTIMVFGLSPDSVGGAVPLLGRGTVVEFDTRQFKTDMGDFLDAFQRAVAKRMRSIHPVFIGLSSGYDSGAIQVALKTLGKAHAAYTIYSTEDLKVIEGRLNWAGDLTEGNVIVLSEEDRAREELYLRQHCEHFLFSGLGRQGALVDDPASHGVSFIFREVRKRGLLVYLSGTGADELLSDYGFGGKKFFPHSSFGGLFPEDLREIFPWPSFFLGTQRDYLMKEELVSGSHGVEGRYPFLDRQVVQEYLWLDASVKNSKYKAPLHALLEGFDYPFIRGEKVGFNADWNVKDGGDSIIMTRDTPKVPRVAPGWTAAHPVEPEEASAGGGAGEGGAGGGGSGGRLDEERRRLEALEELLAERSAELLSREAQQLDLRQQIDVLRDELFAMEAEVSQDLRGFDEERMQRIQMYLFYMLPRLTQMQHTASFAKPRPLPAGPGTRPAHARWQDVEVVTCVSGGTHLMVADFPVYDVFRGTTPLRMVHNICENVEWEGMHFRLKAYARFFEELPPPREGELPILYIVSDGADVFFNDLSEVVSQEGLEGDEDEAEARARATARLIAERYEAVATGAGPDGHGGPRRPVVASTERLCGWGGAKLCSDADEARYPESPTDSKYLNAGGYMGPADALATMISAVLELKESAQGEELEKGRDSDQYYFKRYFWDNQHMIAMDYHQSIFGNFLEVVNKPCENDWLPQCARKPCCTESDDFRRFADLFYGRYEVRGCAVWRGSNLPVSWHGNGAGKWLWLLALDRLALECAPAANVTLARYPVEMLRDVYDKFEKRSISQQDWFGGFLLRGPMSLSEAPTGQLPPGCA